MRTAVALVVLVGCTGAEPEPTEGSLLALTYNVQGLPDALSDSPRPTADRMVDIAPLLDAYDVVGLQETFDEDWHALLTAEATHPIRAWTSDRRDDAVYSAGLGLLSRVGTDVGYDELFYSQCHGTLDGSGDCLATKGLQIQSLQLADGAVLDVVNTHHEAGGGPEDEAARASQVAEAIAALDPSHAVLFMGDTNLRPSDPPDAVLLAEYADAGLIDACTAVGCDETDHIDRFFVRSSDALELTVDAWSRPLEFVDADGEDLSDHPPISVQISWQVR